MITHLQLELRLRMGDAVPPLFRMSEWHVPRLLSVLILSGCLCTSVYVPEGWKVRDSYMN